jgi:hypothetical protein
MSEKFSGTPEQAFEFFAKHINDIYKRIEVLEERLEASNRIVGVLLPEVLEESGAVPADLWRTAIKLMVKFYAQKGQNDDFELSAKLSRISSYVEEIVGKSGPDEPPRPRFDVIVGGKGPEDT